MKIMNKKKETLIGISTANDYDKEEIEIKGVFPTIKHIQSDISSSVDINDSEDEFPF